MALPELTDRVREDVKKKGFVRSRDARQIFAFEPMDKFIEEYRCTPMFETIGK